MKRTLFGLLFSWTLLACGPGDGRGATSKLNDSTALLGTWAIIGEDNATFVVRKDSIYYPDHGATYPYAMKGDSIHIKFDGFNGDYLIKFDGKGRDTLELDGHDRSLFYRFGN